MLLFSCPHPLQGNGPGRPLTRIHEALQAPFGYAVLEPATFPQLGDTKRLGDAIGPVFDELAEALLMLRVPDGRGLFLGGGGASLRQMRYLRGFNMRCGTLWFSSHYAYAERVLKEQYGALGVQSAPIHPYVAWRAGREQEESDFMVVPSEACKATYPEELQGKIHVAEFGVDVEHFSPKVEGTGFKWPTRKDGERLKVLFPATNPARKGLQYVQQALDLLPSSTVWITMTGGWQGTLERKGNILSGSGWLSEDAMLREMQSHHALLLPSLEEGQALASLEGLACGLPVVLTPNVGLEGLHGCGITVGQKGTTSLADEIAEALALLAGDEPQRQGMARQARGYAEARPWKRFQDRIVQIIRTESP